MPVTGTGAAPWTLEISTSPAFDEEDVVYTSAALPANASSHTLLNDDDLTANGLYYWRVLRSIDEPTQVQGHPFYVANTVASVTPQVSSPLNGQWINAANSSTPLTWSAPSEAGIIAILIGYRVEIAKTTTFTAASLVRTEDTSNPALSLPPLPDGTYYWRVRLRLEPDMMGPVSAVRSFKLDATPPGAPLPTAPVASAVLADSTPQFTWSAASGTPTQYVLELASDPDFNSVLDTFTFNAPTLKYTLSAAEALPNGISYWRVRAKDAAGNLSMVSSSRKLIIAAP
jgi:hypothetical protein